MIDWGPQKENENRTGIQSLMNLHTNFYPKDWLKCNSTTNSQSLLQKQGWEQSNLCSHEVSSLDLTNPWTEKMEKSIPESSGKQSAFSPSRVDTVMYRGHIRYYKQSQGNLNIRVWVAGMGGLCLITKALSNEDLSINRFEHPLDSSNQTLLDTKRQWYWLHVLFLSCKIPKSHHEEM